MEGWREDGGEDGMMEGEIEGTEDCIEVGWKEEGPKKRREEQTRGGRARQRGSPGYCSLLP